MLAKTLVSLGKLTEAEQVSRQAFARSAARTGAGSVESVRLLSTLAPVLAAQGRTNEAAALVAAALRNLEQQNIAPDSVAITDMRRIRGDLMVAEGRYPEALQEYRKIQDAFVASPELMGKLAGGDVSWALAPLKTSNPDASLTMLNQLITKSQQWLGDKHLDTMEFIGIKAMAQAVKGDKAAALESFRNALPILLAAAISEGDEP